MPPTERDEFDETGLHLEEAESERMETSPMRVILLVLLVLSTGCERSNTTVEAAEDNSVPDAAETDASAAADSRVRDPAEIPMEVDPAATKVVKQVDLQGAPEEFEVDGRVEASVGWTDRFGMNALVISRQDTDDAVQLTVRHALREGDGSWTTVRTFRERVEGCEFDILLAPELGEWTVSDIDEDGLGEATFAYSAACRSDVSPGTHKVIMTEDGDKYALRGSTRVNPGGRPLGGEFEADSAFENAPEGFRAQAEKVWAATVDER